MDGEFAPLAEDLLSMGIALNMTAANEHVPKVERQIRVIKERVRCTRHTMPFTQVPVVILIQLVYHSVMWLNAFPPKVVYPPLFHQEASFQECPWISRSIVSWLSVHMPKPMRSPIQPIHSTQELWVPSALDLLVICRDPTSFLTSRQAS